MLRSTCFKKLTACWPLRSIPSTNSAPTSIIYGAKYRSSFWICFRTCAGPSLTRQQCKTTCNKAAGQLAMMRTSVLQATSRARTQQHQLRHTRSRHEATSNMLLEKQPTHNKRRTRVARMATARRLQTAAMCPDAPCHYHTTLLQTCSTLTYCCRRLSQHLRLWATRNSPKQARRKRAVAFRIWATLAGGMLCSAPFMHCSR